MSFKTLRKRIALVAASALGMSVFALAPVANASDWAAADLLDCEVGYTSTTALGCSQIVGGRVTISNSAASAVIADVGLTAGTDVYIEVDGATIVSVTPDAADDGDLTFIYGDGSAIGAGASWPGVDDGDATTADNAGRDGDGLILVEVDADGEGANAEEFVITRATAGTSTITVFSFAANGSKSIVETHTVSWIAQSTAGVSASKSVAGWVDAAADCAGATEAAARSALSSNNITTAPAAPTNDTAFLCVFSFDGNGLALDPAQIEVSMSRGNIRSTDGAAVTTSRVTEATGGTLDGVDLFEAFGDVDEVGAAEATIIITDAYDNEITLKAPLTFYGDIKTLTIQNNNYALATDDTEAGNESAIDTDALYLVATDANGTYINLSQIANGIATGTGNLRVDSTYGTVATVGDGEGESDADGAVSIASVNAAGSVGAISVNCDNTAEKLLITAYGLNDDSVDVVSNTATFYCSGSVDKVTLSAAAATANAGATVALSVNVVDKNGYPVADGTAVSLATTGSHAVVNGTGSAAGTTINGGFAAAKPGYFIAGTQGGNATVTAVASGKSGTAAIKVVGGADSLDAQVASLVAAIAKLQKAINKINKRLNR